MLLEVRSIPPTIVLAKAAPGSVGKVTCRPPPLELLEVDERREPAVLGALGTREVRTEGTQGR